MVLSDEMETIYAEVRGNINVRVRINGAVQGELCRASDFSNFGFAGCRCPFLHPLLHTQPTGHPT